MAGEAPTDRAVHVRLISPEIAGGVGVVHDNPTNFAGGHGINFDGASLAAALNERDDLPLVAVSALFLPAVFGMQDPSWATFDVALKSLVNLNRLALAAERRAVIGHRFAG
jgi:hypothetical protein